jgi:F0F1-type ATP synthase membrane subunit c/vacuolar-type H+-ATPase subunit K
LASASGLGWLWWVRVPEAANDIRGTSLLIAFLMEGATIIAVIMALVAKIL